jgi:hypothetical protein
MRRSAACDKCVQPSVGCVPSDLNDMAYTATAQTLAVITAC